MLTTSHRDGMNRLYNTSYLSSIIVAMIYHKPQNGIEIGQKEIVITQGLTRQGCSLSPCRRQRYRMVEQNKEINRVLLKQEL